MTERKGSVRKERGGGGGGFPYLAQHRLSLCADTLQTVDNHKGTIGDPQGSCGLR